MKSPSGDCNHVKLLADTNIFLEIILDQEHASDARSLLGHSDKHELFISDYSFHSIGLLLFCRKQHDVFQKFISDLLSNGVLNIVSLLPEDMDDCIHAAKKFGLDFDDAYQYAVAKKHDFTLVSFDKDFDATDRGRKSPADILI